MAGYYGYRRGRYYRRGYRRGYRRYGGSSLRRYRSVQMNDNETKVMTFTSVFTGVLNIQPDMRYADEKFSVMYLLSAYRGSSSTARVSPESGRPFYAGMMFDRVRFRSVSVTIRPKVMPSSTATNYNFWAAWDRYGHISDNPSSPGEDNTYSIMSDPSAKQVVWTPGGSGTPLRTWIRSTSRDRYQFFSIKHGNGYWTLSDGGDSGSYYQLGIFNPQLLVAVEAVTSVSTNIEFTVQCRFVVEFQGGYSNATLNYTSTSAASAQAATVPLEQRIAALESRYNSNPADNNDDFVSVLNELSNPQ